jgi:hypothetical protein
MEKVISKTQRLTKISRYVKALNEKQQAVLLEELRKNFLVMEAQKLKDSVKKNTITMADIVAEVRKVRKARNAQ